MGSDAVDAPRLDAADGGSSKPWLRRSSMISAVCLALAACTDSGVTDGAPSAAAPPATSDQAVEATAPESFSVTVPPGWEIRPERVPDVDGVFYSAPGADPTSGDNVNIVARPSDGRTLAELDAELAYPEPTPSSGSMITDLESTVMGGQLASTIVWQGTIDASGDELRFWSVWTVHEGLLYLFTYRATPATFEANLAEATMILESFEFR